MPWLLPILPPVARAAASVYYRIRYVGEPVPRTGPVLLVANHPNSLLDPMLVVATAGRPVRFLAKAPLFHDPKTAWLVKSAGAIPVYRRADDPSQVEKNFDAFDAVYAELARGAAVGIFPEGLSHSEPALGPLKTGAARMALGAARLTGGAFPIVPVGLVLRRKDEFRSSAYVVTGAPVAWDDLAHRGVDDADAVHALTDRIAAGLQAVTVNLAQWADQPLVECAVRIWEAEHTVAPTAAERVARVERTTQLLGQVRRTADPEGTQLARDVDRFRRRLDRLRLRPADVGAEVGTRRAVGWAAGKLYLLAPFALAVAWAGLVAFYVPYRLTGWIVGRVRLRPDERSTWKLLIGIGVYGMWVVAAAGVAGVAGAAGVIRGFLVAVVVLLGMPAIGMLGLGARERWRGARDDARRFLLLRSRRDLVAQLREERHGLGARLDMLLTRLTATQLPGT
ncbi:MAG: lysophospholipid acyltransferase family protein [Gemmatimonadota bacterium]|nr:lysophospholipid acyltransferase family protein [Gemmatimonadota bacterium]